MSEKKEQKIDVQSMTPLKRLSLIQRDLNAPKNQYNSFGKYNYRSCEDILKAIKPWLSLYELNLTVSDTIVNVGDYNYIKATVTIKDYEGNVIDQVEGMARESTTKKGMDDSQISGTASSYARKYALNGMFLIDDTKDADTDEFQKTANEAVKLEQKKQAEKQKKQALLNNFETAINSINSSESLIKFCLTFKNYILSLDSDHDHKKRLKDILVSICKSNAETIKKAKECILEKTGVKL